MSMHNSIKDLSAGNIYLDIDNWLVISKMPVLLEIASHPLM